MMTLSQLAQWLPESRLVGDPARQIDRVSTDTRGLQAGDLFVALQGDRFDAHRFLPQARALGAAAAIAQHGLTAAGLAGVEVDDSRCALGQLGAAWRARFESLPLIAVTGSNGKTTVTQMIAAILDAAAPGTVLATRGNFNNDIGVPLTLLRLRREHRFAVLELGMNHPGEIDRLARIARPTVGLVNNAQREHIEFMGSVEAVAAENGAVLESLPFDGVAVFAQAERHAPLWRRLAEGRRCVTFGTADSGATVRLQSARWVGMGWDVRAETPAGPIAWHLQIAGWHNVLNSVAAAAASWSAGVALRAIGEGLATFRPVAGRCAALSVSTGQRTVTVIDDSYNANPDSVRAAIDVLATLPGPRLLALGDMGEVGDQGAAFHREIGRYARECGIEQVLTLGELSRDTAAAFGSAHHFEDADRLCAAVVDALPHVASVLVKGSRFMRMERVVAAITANTGAMQRDVHAA